MAGELANDYHDRVQTLVLTVDQFEYFQLGMHMRIRSIARGTSHFNDTTNRRATKH